MEWGSLLAATELKIDQIIRFQGDFWVKRSQIFFFFEHLIGNQATGSSSRWLKQITVGGENFEKFI